MKIIDINGFGLSSPTINSSYLGYLNNSKFFAGLVMIMLNIGSKYITIELSKSQEAYLKNSVGRQILIFAISWMENKASKF